VSCETDPFHAQRLLPFLFQTTQIYGLNRIYVVDLDGSAPREIAGEFLSRKAVGLSNSPLSAAWHPDGKRVSI
jgi:hypothetical protein